MYRATITMCILAGFALLGCESKGAAASQSDPTGIGDGQSTVLDAAESDAPDTTVSSADVSKPPKKEPKAPACPVLTDSSPAGSAPKNPAGCPADGLGNLQTWIYQAWYANEPVWIGHAQEVKEAPGKWYGIEDKSVWADVVNVSFSLIEDQSLFLSAGSGPQTATVVKAGCYAWNLTPNATKWATETFGKPGAKYCTDVFSGQNVTSGEQFLFIGVYPEFRRILPIANGKISAAVSKLPMDVNASELAAMVTTALSP